MFHLVLVAPQVPPNAGAVGRLALATGSRLHLVRPLGFSLEDREIRKRGLDYWPRVDLRVWENFDELRTAEPDGRFWMFSTKAERGLWQAEFRDGDFLVFGPESKGLPEAWIEAAGERALRIPMREEGTRSLNLASCAAIAVYEAWRQCS